MNEYCVKMKENNPALSPEEVKWVDEIPFDESIINIYPYEEDMDKRDIQVYKIGSEEECREFINDEIHSSIQYLFEPMPCDDRDIK